ncbi:DNA mismatch endonuclease Vsr [Balneolaceae bacterium ANBcel3]|nr:DNA mismatch endonuclease Vsr [Balneolaceae bacterium ANBcel3]
MTDVHDKATRSFNMSRIKGTNTKPEMLVRKYLHENGLRYRLHNKKLPGKPDLTLSKYHTVIFVNGCFWHGHRGCKYFVLPKTRTEWWQDKIEETIKRDIKAMKDLKELGWNSIVIWECELKPEKRNTTLENILFTITKEAKN